VNKILTVSRLFRRKGIQYVIEAMKDVEGYEYIICGDGPFKPYLEQQIERLHLHDKVKLRGHLNPDQLKREYGPASVFVLPSSSENFPVVLMEAMTAECAVITSDTTGCTEVVGDAGLLVPPEDSQKIRDAVVSLIQDPDLRRDIARRGRSRIENEFAWSQVAKKYIRLYEQVLNTT
jgi:glycosyltransferase involved in cell wall biosynthesis